MGSREKVKGKALTACGGILKDPTKYPSRIYQDKRIFFCSEECLLEFDENPEQFMSGKVLHPVARSKPSTQ